MVFYYTLPPKAHARGFRVYMGRDKYENEDLLKYGWENDIWFHVDNISSAHVYLRCPDDVEWDKLPPVVMKYCCQLVKNNSIEGCKKKEVWVIWTPFPNLHKDPNTMVTGAVSFHKENMRKRVLVEKNRELVRSIEKTKEEKVIDFAEELRVHKWDVIQKLKKARKILAQKKQVLKQERKKIAYENSYDRLFDPQGETKNDTAGGLVGLAMQANAAMFLSEAEKTEIREMERSAIYNTLKSMMSEEEEKEILPYIMDKSWLVNKLILLRGSANAAASGGTGGGGSGGGGKGKKDTSLSTRAKEDMKSMFEGVDLDDEDEEEDDSEEDSDEDEEEEDFM